MPFRVTDAGLRLQPPDVSTVCVTLAKKTASVTLEPHLTLLYGKAGVGAGCRHYSQWAGSRPGEGEEKATPKEDSSQLPSRLRLEPSGGVPPLAPNSHSPRWSPGPIARTQAAYRAHLQGACRV